MIKKAKFVEEEEGRVGNEPEEQEIEILTEVLDLDLQDDQERHRKTPQPTNEDEDVEITQKHTQKKFNPKNSQQQHRPNRSQAHSQNNNFIMLNSDTPYALTSRSLYFGNLPDGCQIRDLCDLIRGDTGLEAVRFLPAKACAFIDFISRVGAERFVDRSRRSRTRLQIAGSEVKMGWAKEKILLPNIAKAIENGATRNVYLSLPPHDPQDKLLQKYFEYLNDSDSERRADQSDYFNTTDTEEISTLQHPLVSFLYGIFDSFGPVDMVKIVPARRIVFVHMAQVSDAMRAVAELPTRPEFKGKKISFGRDRCGERLPGPASGATPQASSSASDSVVNNDFVASNSTNTYPQASTQSQDQSQVSRTVYLGNCNSPDITIEDICDAVHTGQLQSARLNSEKHCAFVTFIKSEAAEQFLGRALQYGLMVKNCLLKPAYAKEQRDNTNTNNRTGNSTPHSLPLAISTALRKGYTRNLYLGNLDFAVLSESRLRAEMSHFGPLDRIQLLKDRGVAFVHFANLLDAGRAFELVKSDVCYRSCRVGFGRDRCEPNIRPPSLPPQSQPPRVFYNPSNYPPPPLNPHPAYFHPMMYDPANVYQLGPYAPYINNNNNNNANTTNYINTTDENQEHIQQMQPQPEENKEENKEEEEDK